MRRSNVLLAIMALCGLVVAPALGDDLNPPPWRGDDNSTFARWEFGTDQETDVPPEADWVNPWGMPLLDVFPVDPFWEPEYMGRFGVWPLSGELFIDINNDPVERLYKWIYVQVTWTPMVGEPDPVPTVEAGPAGGPYVLGGAMRQVPVAPEGWFVTTYIVRLQPNPAFEQIHISGDIYVDEVVVDTICSDRGIPTVSQWGLAVMVLLVLSAGTILFRRYRAAAA
jgi:hypothetical protein